MDIIDMRHELVKLAALIDWEFFENEWAGFFPSDRGRSASSPRLVAGLCIFSTPTGSRMKRWWRAGSTALTFSTSAARCETFFQHHVPLDPSSLVRWRKRIGVECAAEWLLTKTIEAGRAAGAVGEASLRPVAVDTTVMEKNIAHPTDARLYERARGKLVACP